jgi:hypothetical protein
VNAIGPYSGSMLMNTRDDDVTAGLQIQSGGRWTVKVEDLTALPKWSGDHTYAGKGDTVLNVDGVFGALDSVKFASHNDDNTVITSYGDTEDLLVNEIGNTHGKYLVPNGTVVLQIEVGPGGTFTLDKT